MKRTRLTAWLLYAGTGLVMMAVAVTVAAYVARPETASSIRMAAAFAYVLQLGAFAALIAARDQAKLFLMALAGVMVLRVAVLGLCAWLSAGDPGGRTPLLLGYIGSVFVLVLLEHLYLRWDLRK